MIQFTQKNCLKCAPVKLDKISIQTPRGTEHWHTSFLQRVYLLLLVCEPIGQARLFVFGEFHLVRKLRGTQRTEPTIRPPLLPCFIQYTLCLRVFWMLLFEVTLHGNESGHYLNAIEFSYNQDQ